MPTPKRDELIRSAIIAAVNLDERTQGAIAKAAKIGPGRLSDYLAGKCDIHTETASRLAHVLNLTLTPDVAKLRKKAKKKTAKKSRRGS